MKSYFTYKILIIALLIVPSLHSKAQLAGGSCGTDDSLASAYLEKISKKIDLTVARTHAGEMLDYRLAVDVDYNTAKLYSHDHAKIREAVYRVIGDASAIFEREVNIRLTVNFIHIWQEPEPYELNDPFDYYDRIREYWKQYRREERDALVSMSTRSGVFVGGPGMCTSNLPGPGENFVVDVLCHELGHTLGSPHTHRCTWPGGPIDRCSLLEFTSEDCMDGFLEPTNGTIMSYCTQELTFHPLCRNLMRAYAEGAVEPTFKLQTLDEKPGAPGLISQLPDKSGELASAPAFEWNPSRKANRYLVQIARDAAFTDMVEDTLVPQTFFRSPGLNAGNYFVRYQPTNTSSSAERSQALSFRVGEAGPKDAPPVLLAVFADNARNINGSFRMLSGISSYQIEASPSWGNPKVTFDLTAKESLVETFQVRPEQDLGDKISIRYRVLRNNQWSRWSDNSFFLAAAGTAPLPINDTQSTSPILAVRQWTTGMTPGPVASPFEIATDPEFKNLAFGETSITNAPNNGYNSRVLFFPQLAENTTYYTRSNLWLNTGFQSKWVTGQFRTGVKDTRFTYVAIPHPVLHDRPGQGLLLKTVMLVKAEDRLIVARAGAGYFETSDLQTWKPYLSSTTNGKSPTNLSAIAAAPDGTIYTIAGRNGMVKRSGSGFTGLPSPPASGIGGFGELVATSSAGLFFLNYPREIVQLTGETWLSHSAALPSAQPICIAKDQLDRIWTIALGGAVWYFENNRWTSMPAIPFSNDTYGIAFDKDNNAYAHGQWGVLWLNEKKGEWEMLPGLAGKSIQKIVFDGQNRMWLAMYRWPDQLGTDFTQFGLLRYDHGKVNTYIDGLNFLREPFDIAYYQDKLAILTAGGELQTFDERQILTFEPGASYPAGSNITVKLSSNSTFEAGNRIAVQLNNKATGTKTAISQTTVNGHSVSFTLPDTLIGGQYTINLLTTAPEITSNESRPFRVAPIGSPTGGQPGEVTLLQNTPNPAIGPSEIGFYLPQAAQVQLDLFNARGQFVKQLADKIFREGWNFVGTDLTGLASGVYVYRLTTGDVVKSMKLVR